MLLQKALFVFIVANQYSHNGFSLVRRGFLKTSQHYERKVLIAYRQLWIFATQIARIFFDVSSHAEHVKGTNCAALQIREQNFTIPISAVEFFMYGSQHR